MNKTTMSFKHFKANQAHRPRTSFAIFKKSNSILDRYLLLFLNYREERNHSPAGKMDNEVRLLRGHAAAYEKDDVEMLYFASSQILKT